MLFLQLLSTCVDRPEDELRTMRLALHGALESLVYGVTRGPEWEDMYPYPKVLEWVMQQVSNTYSRIKHRGRGVLEFVAL